MAPKNPKRHAESAKSEWSFSFRDDDDSPEPTLPPARRVKPVIPQTEEDSAIAAALEFTEERFGKWEPPAEVIDIGQIEEAGVVFKESPWSIAARGARLRENKRRAEEEERGVVSTQVDVNRTNPPSKKLPRPPPSTAPQSKLLKSDSPPPPAPPKKALTIEEGFARQSHIFSLANRRVPHSGPASSAPSKLQTKVLLPKPRATITITPHNVALILKNPSPRSQGAFPLSTPLRNSLQRDDAGIEQTPVYQAPPAVPIPLSLMPIPRPRPAPQSSARPSQLSYPVRQSGSQVATPTFRQYRPSESRSDTELDDGASTSQVLEGFDHSRPASIETMPSSPLPPPRHHSPVPQTHPQSKIRPFKPLRPLNPERRDARSNNSTATPLKSTGTPSSAQGSRTIPQKRDPPPHLNQPHRRPPIISPIPTRPNRLPGILASSSSSSASSSSPPKHPTPLEGTPSTWGTLSSARHLVPTPSYYGSSLPPSSGRGSSSALVTRFSLPMPSLGSPAGRGRGIGIGIGRGRGGGAFRAGMNFAPRESLSQFRARTAERERDEVGGGKEGEEERRLRGVYSSMDF